MSLPFNHGYAYQPYTPQHQVASDQSQHQPLQSFQSQYGPSSNQSPGGSVVNPPGPQMMNNPQPNLYQQVPMVNHAIPEYVDEHSQAFFVHQQHQYQHHIQQQQEQTLAQAAAQLQPYNPGLKQISDTPPVLYPPNVPIPIEQQHQQQLQQQQHQQEQQQLQQQQQQHQQNQQQLQEQQQQQHQQHQQHQQIQNQNQQNQSSTSGLSQHSNFNPHGPYNIPHVNAQYYGNQYSSPSSTYVPNQTYQRPNFIPQKARVENQYPQVGPLLPGGIRPPFQNKFKTEPVTQTLYHEPVSAQHTGQYMGGSGGFPFVGFGGPFSIGNIRPPVISHFKPIETKKNSKPRINKIIKGEQPTAASQKKYLKKRMNSGIYGELSLDSLFNHFQDVMKIESPYTRAGLGSILVPSSFQSKLKSELECQLFDLFVNSLSKSIDIFLPQEAFKKIVPELALYDDTNMILDSMFCLSSLMLQRINPDGIDPSIPIKYYQQSIKSIRSYLSIPGIEINEKGIISRCLLSTILLCIYEMFFVAIDSTYVKGACSILSSILSKHNQNNPSLLKNSPFHQTCFWAMFLCDLILSLKFNLPSMYSINKFWKRLDPEYFELYDNYSNQLLSNNHEDREIFISNSMLNKEHTMWWLHKSLINYGSINEFNNSVDVITFEDFTSNKPYYDWLELRDLIDEFETNMPINLKPTIYKPISNDRVFPLIYFKDEVTAIIGLNFKLSKIALYESLLSKANTKDELVQEELAKYPANYTKKLTKDIIGIMKTYDRNLFVWSVNVHTLRQVAHYVFDEPEAFNLLEELVQRVLETCNLRLSEKIVPR